MQNKTFLTCIVMLILLLMLFGNKKVGVFSVFKRQLCVFKNDKTKKISLWDYICFIVFPVILSLIIVLGFSCSVSANLASVLTTVFAIIFTVLFGFAAILVGKIDSKNEIEKQVVKETFISIMTSNIMSLVATILSIVQIIRGSATDIISVIFSICLFSISFMIIMLLLMISKRTLVIYCNNTKEQ